MARFIHCLVPDEKEEEEEEKKRGKKEAILKVRISVLSLT